MSANTDRLKLESPVRIVRRADGYWLRGGNSAIEDYGPYPSRSSAKEDKPGREAFIRYGHLRSFVTSERGL